MLTLLVVITTPGTKQASNKYELNKCMEKNAVWRIHLIGKIIQLWVYSYDFLGLNIILHIHASDIMYPETLGNGIGQI